MMVGPSRARPRHGLLLPELVDVGLRVGLGATFLIRALSHWQYLLTASAPSHFPGEPIILYLLLSTAARGGFLVRAHPSPPGPPPGLHGQYYFFVSK